MQSEPSDPDEAVPANSCLLHNYLRTTLFQYQLNPIQVHRYVRLQEMCNVRGWEERRPAESQTQKWEERVAEVLVYCANSNKPNKQQN